MAPTLIDSDTYDSGSSYLSSHTFPAIDSSGTNTLFLALGINRNPASDVTGWTADGNAMTQQVLSANTNVVACQLMSRLINDSSVVAVANTPSFKLECGIVFALAGVDQSTPVVGTPVTAGGSNANATASYTGTAGNLLVVTVSTQADKTFTPSNCTTVNQVSGSDANMGSGFVGIVEATGSAQTIGATFSGDTNWRIAIVEIKAAGGAPSEYHITGNVSLNGSGVSGAIIRCIKQSDDSIVGYETSDGSGNYEFSELEEGELYHLCVEYESGPTKYNALSYWDVEPVEV